MKQVVPGFLNSDVVYTTTRNLLTFFFNECIFHGGQTCVIIFFIKENICLSLNIQIYLAIIS